MRKSKNRVTTGLLYVATYILIRNMLYKAIVPIEELSKGVNKYGYLSEHH